MWIRRTRRYPDWNISVSLDTVEARILIGTHRSEAICIKENGAYRDEEAK